MAKLVNTEIKIGSKFEKNGMPIEVTRIYRGMATLKRGKIIEEVPVMHLKTCSLYKKVA
jgi:hypothetical protein